MSLECGGANDMFRAWLVVGKHAKVHYIFITSYRASTLTYSSASTDVNISPIVRLISRIYCPCSVLSTIFTFKAVGFQIFQRFYIRYLFHSPMGSTSCISVSPYLRISVSPYLRISVSPYLRFSVSPFLRYSSTQALWSFISHC